MGVGSIDVPYDYVWYSQMDPDVNMFIILGDAVVIFACMIGMDNIITGTIRLQAYN